MKRKFSKKEMLDIARQVIDIEIDGLKSVESMLDEEFVSAVELMKKTLEHGGKIVVTGVGKNLHIAQKISATFASTGATSVVLHPTQALHGDLGIIVNGDVVLVLSYSGESEEIVALLPLLKREGSKIVAITGDKESTLARFSDIVIYTPVKREACPFNIAPTASTTAILATGDALAMVLLKIRGFNREDYARLHPGGNIGKALLLKVEDIMRTGERVAKVSPDTTVHDVILSMTRARTGITAVVDKSNRLIGVFTDGDLRRNLPHYPDILSRHVSDFMTRTPITIQKGKLAAEAISIFKQKAIDDLVVVDNDGIFVGIVDSQDLPKFKLL